MTEPAVVESAGEPVVEVVAQVDRVPLSDEAAAWKMLSKRAATRLAKLNESIAGWEVGTKLPKYLPNPDNPKDPYKVGEVRTDSGATVAAVSDPVAFLAWCQVNAAGEVIDQPEKCLTQAVPPAPVAALLAEVFAQAQVRCSGPFAQDPAEVIWSLLLGAGWTLTPVQWRPAETFVHPSYVNRVLKLSKEAKEPCAPGGLIPDGVVVNTADPKPYVWVTDDEALQDGYVQSLLRTLPLPPGVAALVLEG